MTNTNNKITTTNNTDIAAAWNVVQAAVKATEEAAEALKAAHEALYDTCKAQDALTFWDEDQCYQVRKKGDVYITKFTDSPAALRKAATARRTAKLQEEFIAGLPLEMQEQARAAYQSSLTTEPEDATVETSEEVEAPKASKKSRKRRTGTDDVSVD